MKHIQSVICCYTYTLDGSWGGWWMVLGWVGGWKVHGVGGGGMGGWRVHGVDRCGGVGGGGVHGGMSGWRVNGVGAHTHPPMKLQC